MTNKNTVNDETNPLGVKIGTPEEVFWTGVKKKGEDMIAQSKHEIIINTKIIELADQKLKEEKQKV